MKKIGIIGHISDKANSINGQTIKTKTILYTLIEEYGKNNIQYITTSSWKTKNIILFLQIIFLVITSKNIIIMPANRGVRIIPFITNIISRMLHKHTHYIVIGGWLPNLIQKNKALKKCLMSFSYIYVETQDMKIAMDQYGFKNILVLPNFKKIRPILQVDFNVDFSHPYKVCFVSRVIKEKGIFDAINAVNIINERSGSTIFILDIYGPIDADISVEFEQSLKPNTINYKGVIDYESVHSVIKDYVFLLFPTYYSGEGFPGVIIDSFFAGTPVIASDWKYNSQIVKDHQTGFIYDRLNVDLADVLIYSISNEELLRTMRKNCLLESEKYTSKSAIKILKDRLI